MVVESRREKFVSITILLPATDDNQSDFGSLEGPSPFMISRDNMLLERPSFKKLPLQMLGP